MEKKRVSTQVHTRALDRAVAKNVLKKKGVPLHRVFKSGWFARNWRVYANAVNVK